MAISEDTPPLPKIQHPISRRAVLSTGIAVTALAAAPVIAADPDISTLRTLSVHYARELQRTMNLIRKGDWKIITDQDAGFFMIMDFAWTPPKRPRGAPKRRKAVRT